MGLANCVTLDGQLIVAMIEEKHTVELLTMLHLRS